MAGALKKFFKLLRYRFLLIAGLLPYCLGATISFYTHGQLSLSLFLTGLIALFFVLAGVEAFNEFFDWQLGTDRVFALNPEPVTKKTLFFGLLSFFIAFLIAIFLTKKAGFTIIIFAFLGFFAAFCYLGPPLKFAYRGLGEVVIAISYGPLMMAGSYYLQSRRIDSSLLLLSLIPGIFLFLIAILNEVPDYFQDRLAGKRNICVRLGQKKVVRLYGLIMTIFYILMVVAILAGVFLKFTWFLFLCIPLFLVSYSKGIKTYEDPYQFFSAIRYLIINYVITIFILISGFVLTSPYKS